MAVLVILPTYNEKENLATLAPAILKIDPQLHLLVVDDNSPDGTGELANEFSLKNPGRVFVLCRSKKQGLGLAYKAGFDWALSRNYDFIVTMDADWSHNPKDIPRLIEASKNYDLVVGSRYLNGVRVLNWPLKRLLLSIFGNFYIRFLTRLPVTDCTSGFQCFRASLLKSIDFQKIKSKGFSFHIELKYRAWKKNFALKEVPIIFSERRLGKPKMKKSIVFEALLLPWRLILWSKF